MPNLHLTTTAASAPESGPEAAAAMFQRLLTEHPTAAALRRGDLRVSAEFAGAMLAACRALRARFFAMAPSGEPTLALPAVSTMEKEVNGLILDLANAAEDVFASGDRRSLDRIRNQAIQAVERLAADIERAQTIDARTAGRFVGDVIAQALANVDVAHRHMESISIN